ncbi:MAG: hypothetical protein ACFBSC_18555 [Microcoleaceae cyanobacterium]
MLAIGKLLGLVKKSEYILEFGDDNNDQAQKPEQKNDESKPQPQPEKSSSEPLKAVVDNLPNQVQQLVPETETLKAVTDSLPDQVQQLIPGTEPQTDNVKQAKNGQESATQEEPKPKKKKKSIKEIRAEKAAQKQSEQPAPAPKPLEQLPSLNPVQPTPAGMTFADYMVPKSTTSRRRPGPSLDRFKNMARQVGR